MTTQPTTYIYSDAECVLHWMKDYPTWVRPGKGAIEQAKSTAVRFADQNAVSLILLYDLEISLIQRNTIYTVEGYRVKEEIGPCPEFKVLATLKRIEPGVEKDKQITMDKVIKAAEDISSMPIAPSFFAGLNILMFEDYSGTAKPGMPVIFIHPDDYKAYKENLPSNPPKQ